MFITYILFVTYCDLHHHFYMLNETLLEELFELQ